MVYFKFDKLDKILIAFTLVVVSMFSIFSCFSYAYSNKVDLSFKPGLYVAGNDVVEISDSRQLSYIYTAPGLKYTIVNNTDVPIIAAFSMDSFEVGTEVSNFVNIESGYSKEFISNGEYKYIGFINSSGSTAFPEVFLDSEGFSSTVSLLANNIGLSLLWSVFENSLPFVLIVVVVSFLIFLISRMLKGLSKGKGRM